MAGLTELFAPQQAPDYSSALEGLQGAQDRITQFLQQNAQPQTAPTLSQIGPMALDLMRGGSYSESLGNMINQQRQQELGNINLALSQADIGLKQAELMASQGNPDAKAVMDALAYFTEGMDYSQRAKLFAAANDDPRPITAQNAMSVFAELAGRIQQPIDPNKMFSIGPDGKPVLNQDMLAVEMMLRQAGATNVDIDMPPPTPPLSQLEVKFDEEGAKIMSEWMLNGGAQDAAKNIEQLTGIMAQLTGDSGLTGPHMLAPEALRKVFMPESTNVAQQIQEVVQRNLRAILGPQFTAKEGQQLIERAFDAALPPEVNAERLDRLLKWMVAAAEAKNDAANYITQNRTLMGWTGGLPSFSGLYDVLEVQPAEPATTGDLPKPASEADYNALAPGTQYIAPDGSLRVKQ